MDSEINPSPKDRSWITLFSNYTTMVSIPFPGADKKYLDVIRVVFSSIEKVKYISFMWDVKGTITWQKLKVECGSTLSWEDGETTYVSDSTHPLSRVDATLVPETYSDVYHLGFYIRGVSKIIGRLPEAKLYTIDDFYKLLCLSDTYPIREILIEYEDRWKNIASTPIADVKHISYVQKKYINYEKVLLFLDSECNSIDLEKSKSMLCKIPYRFRFRDDKDQNEDKQFYEADCLGLNFHKVLTAKIHELMDGIWRSTETTR